MSKMKIASVWIATNGGGVEDVSDRARLRGCRSGRKFMVGEEVREDDGPLEVTVERPERATIGSIAIDWDNIGNPPPMVRVKL
jgi:hypothetical protein